MGYLTLAMFSSSLAQWLWHQRSRIPAVQKVQSVQFTLKASVTKGPKFRPNNTKGAETHCVWLRANLEQNFWQTSIGGHRYSRQ
jgi:hypothetical protein